MSRHVLDRGRLVGFRVHDDGSACVTVRRAAGDRMDYDASPDAAASIARDLATDDVEVLLTEAGLVERLAAETYDLTNALADARADLAAMHARPAPDDAGSLHAQIAGLERALANAESASDRIVAAMRHVADGGPLDHAVMRGVRIDALNVLHRLHPQPPHAGAADVERAPLLSIVGRLYYASDRMQVLDLDGGDLLASVVLPPGVVRAYGGGQPVRLTVNVPPQREGDAAGGQSVPDEREQQERGEGVGGVHGGNVGEGGGAREVP